MPFHAGQTYLYPLDESQRIEHLWVIATEPNREGEFATVSCTTLRGAKDQTVVLQKSEHPFIRQDTCIYYAQATITTVSKLQAYIDTGRARIHQPLLAEVLSLVLDGFNASEFTKNGVRDFVKEYKASRTGKS